MSLASGDARPPKPAPPLPIDPRSTVLAPLTTPEHVRWVGWRFEYRAGKNGNGGKWTKPPHSARGGYARNDTPSTWSTFDQIWPDVLSGRFDGIGLELLNLPGEILAAIDLDDVRDPKTGALVPWAAAIVAVARSYTEITPSQRGLRILGTVKGFDSLHRKKAHPDGMGEFELYVNAGRYITVSAHLLNTGMHELSDITDQMISLLALCDAKPTMLKVDRAADPADSVTSAGADAEDAAEPIDLERLSLPVVELLTKGTIGGQPIKDRSRQFFNIVQHMHRKGFRFATVLATLKAHPGGVHGKYAGRLKAELERAWVKLDDASAAPTIRVLGGKRHEAANAGLVALEGAGVPFYQRDKTLVRISRIKAKASDGSTVIVPSVMALNNTLLGRVLGQVARWQKIKSTGEIIAIDPPNEVVEQIAVMTDEWPFPPLRGVIDTPTLRPDGSPLQSPGYDPATGYVLFSPPPMPTIPNRPDKADALDALALLNNDLLAEFPFTNNASLSVAMSMLMTPVLRAAMAVAPAHVVTAPEAGTGKSYLQDIASMIATGDRCAVMAMAEKPEETEKRLIGAALMQFPIIAMDNVNGLLMGDFLCQVTERPVLQIRPLGTSNLLRIANTFTVFINGNNLVIGADAVRRCVQCALDANMEVPEERTFRSNPMALVLADRGKYIAACLTIARAYIGAGRPGRLPPRASYEGWSDVVRSPLVWLGWSDPVETVASIRTDDPIRQQRAAVFAAWAAELTLEIGYQTSELIVKAEAWGQGERTYPELFAALFAVAATRGGGQQIDARRLAHWLRRNLDTVAMGRKLTVDRSDQQRPYWKLIAVERSDENEG
jgi:hypothetical protein